MTVILETSIGQEKYIYFWIKVLSVHLRYLEFQTSLRFAEEDHPLCKVEFTLSSQVLAIKSNKS